MILTTDDEAAILEWISTLDQADFGVVLQSTGDRIALFSSDQKSILAIGVDFVGWLRRTPSKILPILDRIVAEFGATDAGVVLAATAARLRAVQDRLTAAGPPEETRLAGGVPIVNRTRLRQLLRTAIAKAGVPGEQVRVIKVRGESGLGRTHSWHLIRHVGAAGHATTLKVDLTSPALAQQNVPFLFDYMVHNLGLQGARTPTTEGITADTLAARFADELAGCLGRAAAGWARPLWLVFDNLDRDLAPEVKRFVALLTQARIDQHFENCVVFLLGPDDATEPDDEYRVALTETVVGFVDTEIQDAAACLNTLGTNQLCEDTLAARVADMTCLLTSLRGRELSSQVSRKLVDLRLEVGA